MQMSNNAIQGKNTYHHLVILFVLGRWRLRQIRLGYRVNDFESSIVTMITNHHINIGECDTHNTLMMIVIDASSP
jgi:hypothetical protein